jgi:hypothetical protein
MLSVQMLTKPEDLRLLFVDAKDSQGRNLAEYSGSWGQAGFWRALRLDGTNQAVEATVAIVPNVRVTFYAQPRLTMGGAR